MTTPRSYDFNERLRMSCAQTSSGKIEDILVANIPGAISARKASVSDDRRGTDWWVLLASGGDISVDCKVRETDWSARKHNPADDLALETWSVVERQKIGWTLDETKRTDYVLWLWRDTGRWALVPFRLLLGVFKDLHLQWGNQFQRSRQKTFYGSTQYHSECVFVPRREIWAAIYRKYSGMVASI
jgi:hypothetical protein